MAYVTICVQQPEAFVYSHLFLDGTSICEDRSSGLYADETTNAMNDPGWTLDIPSMEIEADNNPFILIPSGGVCDNLVRPNVDPPGIPYRLKGDLTLPSGTLHLQTSNAFNWVSNGMVQEVRPIVSTNTLPNKVGYCNPTVLWHLWTTCYDGQANEQGPYNAGYSFPQIYLTLGYPTAQAGSPTEMRVKWACEHADGATTPEQACDQIWSWLGPYAAEEDEYGNLIRFGGLDTGWALLDPGTSGQCMNWAQCMASTIGMVGVPGEVKLVYASLDAGAGNCLNEEWRDCPVHGSEHLMLDFNPATPYDEDLNNFEGCCAAAGHYYAVIPQEKATNDYTMLQTLGSAGRTQVWAYRYGRWYTQCDQPGSGVPIP